METLIFKLMVLTYKFLRGQNTLKKISTVLTKNPKINFNSNFWSEKLMATLLYHYSSFELKCRISELLYNTSTVPLAIFNFCKKEGSSNQINPFVKFSLSNHIGVCSFSLLSANKKKIGKTELLNSVLHTRFEVESNDPFGNLRIEVDFGEGFIPKREVAVVDWVLPQLWSHRWKSDGLFADPQRDPGRWCLNDTMVRAYLVEPIFRGDEKWCERMRWGTVKSMPSNTARTARDPLRPWL